MTRTMNQSDFERFELPDLLVTLCEAGQTSLAARIARSLFTDGSPDRAPLRAAVGAGTSAAAHVGNDSKGGGEDGSVAGDEAKPTRAVQSLQRCLQAARRRR